MRRARQRAAYPAWRHQERMLGLYATTHCLLGVVFLMIRSAGTMPAADDRTARVCGSDLWSASGLSKRRRSTGPTRFRADANCVEVGLAFGEQTAPLTARMTMTIASDAGVRRRAPRGARRDAAGEDANGDQPLRRDPPTTAASATTPASSRRWTYCCRQAPRCFSIVRRVRSLARRARFNPAGYLGGPGWRRERNGHPTFSGGNARRFAQKNLIIVPIKYGYPPLSDR